MGKVACIGLGDSIKEFNPVGYELTIGSNDIWKVVKTDIVVCLDNPSIFTPERLKVINECKPQAFYSQMVIWDTRPDFKKIDFFPNYPAHSCRLNTPLFEKSFCSPFVAVQIAWKYYFANEIHLFGVDLINHPHLKGKLCEDIKVHFRNLKIALLEKNCSLIIHGEGILKNI